jgi:hypothetical protein
VPGIHAQIGLAPPPIGGGGPEPDPFWESVIVSINFTGANGSSPANCDQKGNVLTLVGTPEISTAVYSEGSLHLANFNESVNNTTADFAIPELSDFTLEVVYRRSGYVGGLQGIVILTGAGGNFDANTVGMFFSGSSLNFSMTGSSSRSTAAPADNAEHTIIMRRVADATTCVLDGVILGVTSGYGGWAAATSEIHIGGFGSGFEPSVNGEIRAVRYTQAARYVDDVFPASLPLPLPGG